MATAKELFDSAQLQAAIDQLTSEVKAHPTDVARRIFLFELLAFAGQWERAEKQLDVIAQQDARAETGAQVYRNNITAERARRRVFNDGQQPKFLTKPPEYVLFNLLALSRLRDRDYQGARELLEQAEEARPARAGKLNDQPFADFRDAADFIGPVLELISQGEYVWLPFEHISFIEIAPPAHLRDLLWATARIQTDAAVGGFEGEAFVPALYSGSELSADDQIRIGRMTAWQPLNGEFTAPLGLRLFTVDDEDLPLFDATKIEFASTTV